jgi:NTP pyrophosphatase (non-canonical NTP hydrolase)
MTRHTIHLFLQNALLDLSKKVRKGNYSQRELLVSLSSVFSRTVSLVNSFKDLPIVESLCVKYPFNGCGYCQELICICTYENRPDFKGAIDVFDPKTTTEQKQWSIKNWCRHLNVVYGKTNRERGIQTAIMRLQEELLEVSDCEFVASVKYTSSNPEFILEISKEFADVFAWIFAIANMLEVNLDGIISAWAFKPCTDCKRNPCKCGALRIIF